MNNPGNYWKMSVILMEFTINLAYFKKLAFYSRLNYLLL
jgi:hypothetical protein